MTKKQIKNITIFVYSQHATCDPHQTSHSDIGSGTSFATSRVRSAGNITRNLQ